MRQNRQLVIFVFVPFWRDLQLQLHATRHGGYTGLYLGEVLI